MTPENLTNLPWAQGAGGTCSQLTFSGPASPLHTSSRKSWAAPGGPTLPESPWAFARLTSPPPSHAWPKGASQGLTRWAWWGKGGLRLSRDKGQKSIIKGCLCLRVSPPTVFCVVEWKGPAASHAAIPLSILAQGGQEESIEKQIPFGSLGPWGQEPRVVCQAPGSPWSEEGLWGPGGSALQGSVIHRKRATWGQGVEEMAVSGSPIFDRKPKPIPKADNVPRLLWGFFQCPGLSNPLAKCSPFRSPRVSLQGEGNSGQAASVCVWGWTVDKAMLLPQLPFGFTSLFHLGLVAQGRQAVLLWLKGQGEAQCTGRPTAPWRPGKNLQRITKGAAGALCTYIESGSQRKWKPLGSSQSSLGQQRALSLAPLAASGLNSWTGAQRVPTGIELGWTEPPRKF